MTFWHLSWEFVNSKIMGFFAEFFELSSLERSLNFTFIVLSPPPLQKKKRKKDAKDLRDFRPISLVGGLYKLLAKV